MPGWSTGPSTGTTRCCAWRCRRTRRAPPCPCESPGRERLRRVPKCCLPCARRSWPGRRTAPKGSWVRGSALEGRRQHNPQAVQVAELLLERFAPGGEIVGESGPVTVLERVFELV